MASVRRTSSSSSSPRGRKVFCLIPRNLGAVLELWEQAPSHPPPPVACGLSALDGEAGSKGKCGASRLAPRMAAAPCATCRGSLWPAAHRRELRSEGTLSLPRAWAPGRLLPDPHSACGACLSLPISSARSYGSRLFLMLPRLDGSCALSPQRAGHLGVGSMWWLCCPAPCVVLGCGFLRPSGCRSPDSHQQTPPP